MTDRFFLGLDQSVVVSLTASTDAQDGMTEVDADLYASASGRRGLCRLVNGALQDYTPPPPPKPQPYLTGKDVIDGMSKAQANDPQVDQRDLIRIGAASRASEVKSCIARIEKDLKLTAGTLVSQATASGGL